MYNKSSLDIKKNRSNCNLICFNCSSILYCIWSKIFSFGAIAVCKSNTRAIAPCPILFKAPFQSTSTLSKLESCKLRFISPLYMMPSKYLNFCWNVLRKSIAFKYRSKSAFIMKGFFSGLVNNFAYLLDTTLFILLWQFCKPSIISLKLEYSIIFFSKLTFIVISFLFAIISCILRSRFR